MAKERAFAYERKQNNFENCFLQWNTGTLLIIHHLLHFQAFIQVLQC
jgi:hypothetical protein